MSQKLTDQSLRSELRAASLGGAGTIGNISDLDDRIQRALQAASEKKALNSTVLDLRGIATFTDFFLITTGANKRQMQAIADEVLEQLKRQGTRAARVEGYQTAEWILLDYGDFIVHVFDEKSRRFYDLERLWRQAKRIDIPSQTSGADSRDSTPASPRSGSLKEE